MAPRPPRFCPFLSPCPLICPLSEGAGSQGCLLSVEIQGPDFLALSGGFTLQLPAQPGASLPQPQPWVSAFQTLPPRLAGPCHPHKETLPAFA